MGGGGRGYLDKRTVGERGWGGWGGEEWRASGKREIGGVPGTLGPIAVCPPPLLQWSFGVVLWELMTLGKVPYEEIEPEDMLSHLTAGHRLTQPKNCPDEM